MGAIIGLIGGIDRMGFPAESAASVHGDTALVAGLDDAIRPVADA